MTRILLAGMVLATVLLTLGMSAQSFAMSMPNKTQDVIQRYVLAKDTTQQQMMLVSDPPTTKGGMATFHLVPRPQNGIDSTFIPIPTNSPELILSSVSTPSGGTMLKLIQKPQEGIDDIPILAPTKPTTTSTQPESSPQPQVILSSVSTPGGGTVLKLIPKPQEGIDNIPIPKAADSPTMLVAEPVTSKSSTAVFHLVPKPAHSPWDFVS